METAPTELDGRDPFSQWMLALASAPEAPVTRELSPGQRLGVHLEIRARAGHGGMGVVYRARDHLLGRDVAIKVMRSAAIDPARLAETFRREARATARLAHPNIVVLHQFGEEDGLLYLVLEHLEGETLAARLERGPLPRAEALSVIEQVAAGLAYAHGEGVVHRDIKPHNVFLGADGRARILDFGLAAIDDEARAGAAPSALSRAGTPGYMAPEQWRGEVADARTDVWALAVMAIEVLSGVVEPEVGGGSRPAPVLRGRWPRALREVLRRASAEDRALRRVTADALARAVASARTAPPWRRGVTAALVVAAALVVMGMRTRGAPEAPLELSGTWAYVPEGRAAVELDRVGPGVYRLSYSDAPEAARPSAEHFWIEGELTLRTEPDGTRVLDGLVADRPGWGKGQVGRMRFEVLAADRLRMTHSEWGKTHAFYHFHYPEWLMVRVATRPPGSSPRERPPRGVQP